MFFARRVPELPLVARGTIRGRDLTLSVTATVTPSWASTDKG